MWGFGSGFAVLLSSGLAWSYSVILEVRAFPGYRQGFTIRLSNPAIRLRCVLHHTGLAVCRGCIGF